jgi:Domain of unknown function (DU1801)
MGALKTKPTKESVRAYIAALPDPAQKQDAKKLASLMSDVTGQRGRLWGTSMVGFGSYRYSNSAGKESEWLLTGFSPRKQALSIYVMSGFAEHQSLLGRLGKYKTGKSCLYVKRLADIDEAVLRQLIEASVAYMRERYPTE